MCADDITMSDVARVTLRSGYEPEVRRACWGPPLATRRAHEAPEGLSHRLPKELLYVPPSPPAPGPPTCRAGPARLRPDPGPRRRRRLPRRRPAPPRPRAHRRRGPEPP